MIRYSPKDYRRNQYRATTGPPKRQFKPARRMSLTFMVLCSL
jgi:hypothetical protein